MKRLLKIVLAAVLALSGIVTFLGCTEEKYNIIYTLDGQVVSGSPSTYVMSMEDPINLWIPAPREGLKFDGWYEKDDCTGVQSTTIAPMVSGEKKYFGRFIQSSYKITYYINGAPIPKNYEVSSTALNLWDPEDVPVGFVFGGWYLNADYSGEQQFQIAPNTAKDLAFYGTYVDPATITFYDITYYLDGVKQNGTVPATYKQTENATTLWMPDIDTSKCSLEGWYTTSDYTGTKVSQIPANTQGNKTFYGRIREPEGYGNQKNKINFTLDPVNQKVGNDYITSTGVSISSFYGKKPVLIGFWSARCSVCKKNMNNYYKKLYDELKDEVEFLMVHVGETPDYAHAEIDANDYPFPYYYDKNAVVYYKLFENAGLVEVPRAIFVDKWGYETGRLPGEISSETQIRGYISNAINAAP